MSEKFDFWAPIREQLNRQECEIETYKRLIGDFLLAFNEFERNCNLLFQECLFSKGMKNFHKIQMESNPTKSVPVYKVIERLKALQKDFPDDIRTDFTSADKLRVFRNEVAHSPIGHSYDIVEDESLILQLRLGRSSQILPISDFPDHFATLDKLNKELEKDTLGFYKRAADKDLMQD